MHRNDYTKHLFFVQEVFWELPWFTYAHLNTALPIISK